VPEENTEFWAVVEVMGHNTYAGRVSDITLGGASFVRVDVPEIPEHEEKSRWSQQVTIVPASPEFTKIIGPGSIYCITPCTEAVAREVTKAKRQAPITAVDLAAPKALTAGTTPGEDDDDDPDDDEE